MGVVFQGRVMDRCPEGYTICRKLVELTGQQSNLCISTSECEAKLSQAQESTQPENEEAGDDLIQQQEEEERQAQEKRQENIGDIEDFLELLKRGIIVDPETGKNLGMLDPSRPDEAISFFKTLSTMYSNETLGSTKFGKELSAFMNILSSDKLSGRTEVTSGLLEKFLQNTLGMDVNFMSR